MTNLIVSLIISALLFAVSLFKKTLTLPAAVLSSLIMICIGVCSSYREALFLMLSYMIIVIIDLLLKDKAEKKVSDIHKKSGTRGVTQILANGSFATISAILLFITGDRAFLYTYIACVSEACADSIASDVGVLSKKEPISILTFKRVRTGMSGGVSLLGMMSSLLGCVVMALISTMSVGFSVRNIIFLILVPYVGMMLDSFIGASLQAKFKCSVCGKPTEKDMHCNKPTVHVGGIKWLDNSAVNIITNAISGAICYFAVKIFLL